jgi:hypothetical protein
MDLQTFDLRLFHSIAVVQHYITLAPDISQRTRSLSCGLISKFSNAVGADQHYHLGFPPLPIVVLHPVYDPMTPKANRFISEP